MIVSGDRCTTWYTEARVSKGGRVKKKAREKHALFSSNHVLVLVLHVIFSRNLRRGKLEVPHRAKSRNNTQGKLLVKSRVITTPLLVARWASYVSKKIARPFLPRVLPRKIPYFLTFHALGRLTYGTVRTRFLIRGR